MTNSKPSHTRSRTPARDLTQAAEELGPRPRRVLYRRPRPTLRLSPMCWAKLLFLRDVGLTEIGAFGIAPRDDLLYLEDVELVRQHTSWGSVRFDDAAVADFFDAQVDAGRHPEQFARVWVHTHPGGCAEPSGTDEETFARVFGRSAWAVMFILARESQTYARLRFGVGPGGELTIPVTVDYSRPFSGSAQEDWKREYGAYVQPEPCPYGSPLPFTSGKRARPNVPVGDVEDHVCL